MSTPSFRKACRELIAKKIFGQRKEFEMANENFSLQTATTKTESESETMPDNKWEIVLKQKSQERKNSKSQYKQRMHIVKLI